MSNSFWTPSSLSSFLMQSPAAGLGIWEIKDKNNIQMQIRKWFYMIGSRSRLIHGVSNHSSVVTCSGGCVQVGVAKL